MLRISSSIVSKANSLTFASQFQYAKTPRKIPNLHQRLKRYGKYPNKYKLITLIRPPDLRDPTIEYPIRIPIRYRHLYKPTKPLFIDNTKQIKWQRLTPNEILLAFQHIQYLKHDQLVTGLEYLSKIKGQQNHNWNQHPWVNQAFQYFAKHFARIKVTEIMKFYYLMKKLGCQNQPFWDKMYKKIEQHIYDVYPSDFQYLFLKYYKVSIRYFSEDMSDKFMKLMQGRLRQFKNGSLLTVFEIYMQGNLLDNYWLENVFVPLFKLQSRKYNIEQIGKIFRYMMIIGHENNERLYDALYSRILKIEYQSIEQVENIEQIILEVKEIFTSHRVEPYLQFFEQKKQELKNVVKENKKSLHQIVKQDLIFFAQKKKIRTEQKTL